MLFRSVYDLYAGASSERIREVDDYVEHSDPPRFLREARQWMQRWLKNDTTPLLDETNRPKKEAAETLACLSSLPADAVNYKIQNQFTAWASLKSPASQTDWERRRQELISQLKDKVFRWFPPKKRSIPFETKVSKSTGSWAARYDYARYKEVSFQTEDGV